MVHQAGFIYVQDKELASVMAISLLAQWMLDFMKGLCWVWLVDASWLVAASMASSCEYG
jgi:hypothetical protein